MTAVRQAGLSRPRLPGGLGRVLSASSDRAPRLLGDAAALVGIVLIADVLFLRRAPIPTVVKGMLPDPAGAVADAMVLLCGWALLRVARGLRHAKRTEFYVATAACIAAIVADVTREPNRPAYAVLVGLLLVGLCVSHARFTAVADPVGRSHALRVGSELLAVTVFGGLVLLYLPGHVAAGVSLGRRLEEVVQSAVGAGGSLPIRSDGYADLFHATMLGFGMVTAVATVLFWLRPAQPESRLTAEDECRLSGLLRVHGARDSLGYFALRRDKAAVWSHSGKAAITYRVLNGVALASGDPLGDPEAWPGAIESYRRLLATYGWTPAVMGCSELGATVFKRELGLSVLELGDEAIVRADQFTLQGRAMRCVRQACTRVQRAGYTVAIARMGDLSEDERSELIAAAQAWRGDEVERGFSMALSRFGDPADGCCLLVTARKEGVLAGLLHFVPWSNDGLSLDLMRRDREADNGLNEYMIAQLLLACPSLGINRVSLNFAMFRDALARGGRVGAGPVLRLWRRILLIASRWYQIDSLYRFNDKFAPDWEPRYFAYPRARDLPRIAVTALEAEAFLVRPHMLDRLLGRTGRTNP